MPWLGSNDEDSDASRTGMREGVERRVVTGLELAFGAIKRGFTRRWLKTERGLDGCAALVLTYPIFLRQRSDFHWRASGLHQS